ncbi:alpha/beta hydrolase [Candidatus Peregrinibacteria bacterium]|nr:alpha/beta hydrolase [Candidatus Peregrinibacteria bacterium]
MDRRHVSSENSEDTQWFFADAEAPKAVAAVVHGLNMRPSKMGDIVEELRKAQVDVLRVALTGHRGKEGEIKTVTRDVWLDDMADAYWTVSDRACAFDAPKYFVGYSLGGLLQVDLMQEQKHMRYDRMALFAPALRLRNKTHMLRMLTKWMPRTWKIPSLNSFPGYFINHGLSAAAYHAVFDSYASVSSHEALKIAGDIPTKVFIHPRDELVSAAGLTEIVDQCPSWSIDPVERVRDSTRYGIFHLITDQKALGDEEWNRVTLSMQQHFLS